MHDGEIQVMGCIKLLTTINQFVEPGSQCIQVFEVIIGFDSGVHDLFLQLGKGICVSALISFQESEDILHFVRF